VEVLVTEVVVCADDDVLPWPSCDRMDPPQEHSWVPVFLARPFGDPTARPRDARGRFKKQVFYCERCDRGMPL